MSDDVRSLLQSIGAPDFEYREVAAIERWQAAAQRWPLLASVNRTLVDRFLSPELERPPQPNRRLQRGRCIAVASLQGGTGRTTIVANLAQALAQNGRSALAVDLDPQGALGLHFGVDPEEETGLFQHQLSRQGAAEWLARFRGGPAVLPFGKLTAAQLSGLESTCARDPSWLPKRIQSLMPDDCEFVLLDLPAATHPLWRAAVGIADKVVALLSPEPSAYATLPQLELLFDECSAAPGRRGVHYLLNRFDARRALDRDLFASLRGMMGPRALPFPIHADPVVAEALARRRLIMQEAADSQVVAGLGSLAEWVEQAGQASAGRPAMHAVG